MGDMAMAVCLVGSPKTPNNLPARNTANYHPSIWGDRFISHASDEATLPEWREKAENLKRQVQRMLSEDHELPNKRCHRKLSLIDAIQRLGVAYHFEEEIEQELARNYYDQIHNDVDDQDDLHTLALRFRLLREHGYSVTCDIFRKFMDNEGNFNKSLCDDVDALLSLYEATYLGVQGEAILNDALNFTRSSLQSLLPNLSPFLAKQVLHALNRPLRKSLARLEARNYFSIYEQTESHSETLLHFAKLDFNILQKSHQGEFSIISKWWKDLDCPRKFPFARDRIVECYFWILGVYFEPQYAMARRFLTQVIALTSIADDIYDAYGTKEELELFTKALERWDVSSTNDLPEYMKVYYQQLLDVYYKTEEETIRQGRPLYGVQLSKEALKGLFNAYWEETKWLDTQDLPTFEEYMKVALISSGYQMLSVSSLVWIGDVPNEEAFDWLLNQSKTLEAASTICRLMNDIVSYKFEQERRHRPSAIECYSTQYGVSEEKACNVLRDDIENAWKDINEAFLTRSSHVAMPVLMRVLNLCRVIDLLYRESDGYTHVNPMVKECITSLLCNDVEV